MAKRPEDRFANLASSTVTLSAANTLTFAELQTGISLGAGIGLLIDQIDYFPHRDALQEMTANADAIQMAWSTSNNVTDLTDASDSRIIDTQFIQRMDYGTAASGEMFRSPLISQFFPPLIVASSKLYFGVYSHGLASAANAKSRIHFRYIELSDKEYLEIAETFILVG